MTVHLVGAGPGDPGLLTRRGAELVAAADVVVHDRLVAPALLRLARRGAELVDAGPAIEDDGAGVRDETVALVVTAARQGRRVVRLVVGDPYVFGRGADEAIALAAAGVALEVVPGLCAALAAPLLAGIPVVQGDASAGVTVVSGRDPGARGAPDWAALVRARTTLVVVTGAERRDEIARRLVAGGMDPETPAAAVELPATALQRTVRTTLAALGRQPVASPATLVIGAVARLRLATVEDRPLARRRVVVTRAADQAGALSTALAALGAEVVEFPTLEITDPPDAGAALRAALETLKSYAWIVFASTNAVERCFAELRDARALAGPAVAAVGEATAAALRRRGVVADLVPDAPRAAGLLAAFPGPAGPAERVLVPRALAGNDELPEGLRARGFVVDAVAAYATRTPAAPAALLSAIKGADALTFASGSAVAGFLEMAGRSLVPPVVATVGPVTSAAVRSAGLEVAVEAPSPSPEALASALGQYFAALRFGHVAS